MVTPNEETSEPSKSATAPAATGQSVVRPRLPTRSNSTRSYQGDPAPHDAARSDDKAIADVYESVEETGSLEAAAKKLHQVAIARAWEDDPEEAAYLAQTRQAWRNESAVDDEYEYDEDDDEAYVAGPARSAGLQEVVHLQEIVPGLWVGDLVAAMDADGLEQRGIKNILSLLRPSLQFSDQFAVYPLEIDDNADTDILTHLPSCVAWINDALEKKQQAEAQASGPDDKGKEVKLPGADELPSAPPTRDRLIDPIAGQTKPGGVLVHCQAGMSRSATVAAAYLMRVLDIDPVEAVQLISEKRPVVDPSATFWYQLGLFYNANGRVSLKDRSTRQYYMERATSSFMNGDVSAPSMDKMAKYPQTPTLSRPATPAGTRGRRKIRCKACRRVLAVREHMMDHILDQAPVSRPRTPTDLSLPGPARTSFSFGSGFTSVDPSKDSQTRSRRTSIVSDVINPLTGLPGATRSRNASLSMTPSMEPSPVHSNFEKGTSSPGIPSPGGLPYPKTGTPGAGSTTADTISNGKAEPNKATESHSGSVAAAPSGRQLLTADELASRLPPHLQALRTRKVSMSDLASPFGGSSPGSSPEKESPMRQQQQQHKPHPINSITNPLASIPVDSPLSMSPLNRSPAGTPPLASGGGLGRSRSQGASSKSKQGGPPGRRLSTLAMTPADGTTQERRGSGAGVEGGGSGLPTPTGPPILVNPKCSGYFVEPLTWMEGVLQNGDISGKIVCPNEKCGVKLGNFDWAGVQCGCKEWVTPGFCIHRSKVDEVF